MENGSLLHLLVNMLAGVGALCIGLIVLWSTGGIVIG